MKQILKRLIPFALAVGIIASIGWYLLIYDTDFTRDILLSQARYQDAKGIKSVASFLYDLAYDYTGQDENVAIELANQYKADGNYTKAEYTLVNAIADGGDAQLYIALCKTFVEQDKLLDALNMLDHISDPAIKAEIDALRPAAPLPDYEPGFYSQYIHVDISAEGMLYTTFDESIPSTRKDAYTEPYILPAGESTIWALCVGENGLVSPLAVFDYTVTGVIEEAVFTDTTLETAVRELLGVDDSTTLMTNQLWDIIEFTVPQKVENYEDLALLPYLESLTITDRKLSSLSFLSSLNYLTQLHISECSFPVDDLSIIAALPQLNTLTLSECGLSTISGLAEATNLTKLNLSGNTLRNLDVLSSMIGLTDLYLQHNAVTKLDAISVLSHLKTLDISYNSVSSLDALSSCTNLTWLNAGNNQISSLSGVEALQQLTHLDLDHNTLSSVDLLKHNVNLTELNISNNALTDIDALLDLTKLTTLNLAYNQVVRFPYWPSGTALTTIDGSYNQIVSVYQLRYLEDLTYLYVDYNRLTTLDDIADCFRLVMVNAYGNDIENVDKLTSHNIIVNYDPTTDVG